MLGGQNQQGLKKRNLLVILLLLCVSMLSSCAGQRVEPWQRAKVGSHTMSFAKNGSSAPVVVFESGIGDGISSWDSVYNQVSQFASVFVYNRPGYGDSEKVVASKARTASDAARRLKLLLDSTGTPGPYILVGHSAGGLYALKFVEMYPDDVAGIVLVDGRPKKFSEACEAEDVWPCAPSKNLVFLMASHIKAEILGLGQIEAQAPNPQDLGDLPITVITATKPPPGAPKRAQPIWIRVQREFARQLSNGHFVLAKGAGHYIHKDKPELVIREIRKMVENDNRHRPELILGGR